LQDVFFFLTSRASDCRKLTTLQDEETGVHLLSCVHMALRGERESKACTSSYVQDSNDLCPTSYLVNVVQSLENVSRAEQVAVFPAAI